MEYKYNTFPHAIRLQHSKKLLCESWKQTCSPFSRVPLLSIPLPISLSAFILAPWNASPWNAVQPQTSSFLPRCNKRLMITGLLYHIILKMLSFPEFPFLLHMCFNYRKSAFLCFLSVVTFFFSLWLLNVCLTVPPEGHWETLQKAHCWWLRLESSVAEKSSTWLLFF